jgi:hypothetical protein
MHHRNRRKRPGIKPAARPERQRETPESKLFRDSMAHEEQRGNLTALLAQRFGPERAARILDAPCFVCGNPQTAALGMWNPAEKYARMCGRPKGHPYLCVYMLCHTCASRQGKQNEWIYSFIEAKVVAMHRGENIVYLGSNGLPIVGNGEPEGTASCSNDGCRH